jgi:predicted  nucleic acid-binding Zn-ribbon protein
MIAEAAYFRAAARGFRGGDPVGDWLAAENEVNAQLRCVQAETQTARPQEEPIDDWLQQLESKLEAADRRLKTLKRKLRGLKDDTRRQLEKDLDKFGKLRDRFEKRVEALGKKGEHASEKGKLLAEKTWGEISELTHRLGSRLK